MKYCIDLKEDVGWITWEQCSTKEQAQERFADLLTVWPQSAIRLREYEGVGLDWMTNYELNQYLLKANGK